MSRKASDSADVVKIVGAPGCGKTTTLLDELASERRQGLGVSDFYYLTFTTSAREEAADRLLAEYRGDIPRGLDDDDVRDRAKTLHSAAVTAAVGSEGFTDPSEQIIAQDSDPEVYERFCHQEGITYTADDDTADDILRDGVDTSPSLGNKIFAISEYLTAHRAEYDQAKHAPVELAPSWKLVYNPNTGDGLLPRWERFKRNADGGPYFEHGDYVDIAIDGRHTPPVTRLFIDEFQDLTPQEYTLVRTWRDSGALERIYVAGDPRQSIYGFREGSPYFLENTPADRVETLDASYRCPPPVVAVARGILRAGNGGDEPAGFSSNREGGSAERVELETPEALAASVRSALSSHRRDDGSDGDGTVFCLARTNRHAGYIAHAMGDGGIPYSYLGGGYDPWPASLRLLLEGYQAAAGVRDSGVSAPAVDAIITALPGELAGTFKTALSERYGDMFEPEGVRAAFEEIGGWKPTIGRLRIGSDRKRDRLQAAVNSGVEPDPSAVKVGTIHAAKGLEAPAVYLFDGYSRGLLDRYQTGEIAQEERRVYYVGATRASETLRVVNGYVGGKVFPPFEGGLPIDEPADEPPARGVKP